MELRTQIQVSQYICLSLLPGHYGSNVHKGVLRQVLLQVIPCQLTFKQYSIFTSFIIQDMHTKLLSNSSSNSPSLIPQLLVTSYSHIISAIYTAIVMNTVH